MHFFIDLARSCTVVGIEPVDLDLRASCWLVLLEQRRIAVEEPFARRKRRRGVKRGATESAFPGGLELVTVRESRRLHIEATWFFGGRIGLQFEGRARHLRSDEFAG